MRSIQEAPQSNRGGRQDGFAVLRRSPTRGGDREFATSSDVARSSLPQDEDPEVCAREVLTRVGQTVSGLTETNSQLGAVSITDDSPGGRLGRTVRYINLSIL